MLPKIIRPLLISFVILSSFTWICAQSGKAAVRLRPIQKDGKWGYIDHAGKIVIEPQFAWAEEFAEGLAAFENEEGKHGYIDETGKVIIEPIFDNWTEFSEGLAAVSVDFTWGYIDKAGTWVIPRQFSLGTPFSSGLALVRVPPSGKPTFPPGPVKYVFIDKTGQVVLSPKDDILNGSFSEGFAAVQFVTNKGVDEVLIDKAGKIIFVAEDINLDGFKEGLAAVMKNGKWGYIDTNGQFVIEPQFEDALSFSEGLAAVRVGGKWGYINREGKIVIKPKYGIGWDTRRHDFSEGLALVFLNDDCGYVDKGGKVVIRLQCDRAEEFAGGIASIYIRENNKEKRGYINRQGKFVWGPSDFKYKPELIQSRAKKETKDEEVLLPLTEQERSVDPRDLVANQPDFVADLTFFRSETYSGSGGSMRIARKGNRYREESQYWIFIGETGKPAARLFPGAKTYNDMEPARDESAGGSQPFNPKTLAKEPDVTFNILGAVMIDGQRYVKIEASRKGKPEKLYLYTAPNLKNLIVIAKILKPPFGFIQMLSNVSFDVPDSLVEIPSDYKPIEHDRWTRVETARVTYKGKPSKDFGVFRAPGGELFIWAKDAHYDWYYLVRPREATMEPEYMGMLIARSGKYIWLTSETEAYSDTYYRKGKRRDDEVNKQTRVVVKPNSVKFRANNYAENQGTIEVRW